MEKPKSEEFIGLRDENCVLIMIVPNKIVSTSVSGYSQCFTLMTYLIFILLAP